MLNRTSELAIKAMLVLGLEGGGRPVSPRWLCGRFECSPTYLAKLLGMLVRADLLRSLRGARGGFVLARPPEEITLLAIVEASQGFLIGNYCRAVGSGGSIPCAFHLAMEDVQRSTREALARWTLADLMRRPTPADTGSRGLPCKMAFRGWERYVSRSAGG